MSSGRRVRWTVVGIALCASGCWHRFNYDPYPTNEALYAAAVHEYDLGHHAEAIRLFEHLKPTPPLADSLEARANLYLAKARYTSAMDELALGHYGTAIRLFDRLTIEVSTPDSIRYRARFNLAQAQFRRGLYEDAAGSFDQFARDFPQDTLADDATLWAGISNQRRWRRPDTDPQEGLAAMQYYETLLLRFPDSPLRAEAVRHVNEIQDMFAQKEFESAMFYMRRHATNSAVDILAQLLENYPDTPTARDAYLTLVDAYRKLKWSDNAADACTAASYLYPGDAAIHRACAGGSASPIAR